MAGASRFLILALETATPCGSVALVSGDIVLANARLPEGRQASGTIIPAFDGLFRDARAAAVDVTHVAVSAGPGSFTGLRVGMAAAKGFCYGIEARIIPVPTLHALALRFPFTGGTVCPVLDAKKNEVYSALFRWDDGECRRIQSDIAVAPESLPDRLPGGKVFFCGDGAFSFRAFFVERLGDRAVFPPDGNGRPDASSVGILASRLLLEGAEADVRTLVPAYLRSPEAEVKRRG
ncbi:MAG: tRNA (adenosine(37)-N6)-threonylcarbamoyltransferase complex dimerization subunit type 1 TsaB [Deltaproteobacteria bacterium]|nr:tRNA (adenosine(37)-N6)-threonylcarbamoyltransferase complex dimerization subunit type 1 TsaB [Deltaproteobacteria bacterium]